jgi:oxygen-independent coproporphyrinogen III oxidase
MSQFQTSLVENIAWNAKLISEYDLTGPRYTSYPTALQFSEHFSLADFNAAVNRSNVSARPLSLYVHIPFCDTLCFYCGCNKVVTHNKNRSHSYLTCVEREMASRAGLFDTERPVTQLHWGGGTPTFISDDEMTWLMNASGQHFHLLDDDSGEYSIEIHPGRVAASTMKHLRQLGFNRVSMGVQDFDAQVQQAVNRYNSLEEVTSLVHALRQLEYHSISMDLIYGLPRQTLEGFKETLHRVIDLSPDRLSLFNYAHMPHLFKSQALINENELPSASTKLELLHMAIECLQTAGYVYIGMDHFAKPTDGLVCAQQEGKLQRNFQGYSTHGDCDLLSFGASAISAFGQVYVQNAKRVNDYERAITSGANSFVRGCVLTNEDLLRQAVINQLICHFCLDFAKIKAIFGMDVHTHFAQELSQLQPMIEDGLLILDEKGIRVENIGRLLIRRICMVFDEYLTHSKTIQYSKVI